MTLNSVLVAALAVGVGFVLWAGFISAGFAALELGSFLKEVLGLKQTLFVLTVLFAIGVFYMTGKAVLVAAGAI